MAMRASWRIDPPRPFDLRGTVLSHGFYEVPPFRWDNARGRLEVALRIPGLSAPVLLGVEQHRGDAGRPVLEIDASWTGPLRTGRIRAHVDPAIAHCLDFGRDLRPFYSMCRAHPPLAWVPRARAGRILRCPDVTTDVIVSICGTNTTWRQAVRSVRLLSDVAPSCPGTGVRAFPTPAEILSAGADHLVGHARVGYRHRTILDLCSRVSTGQLDPGAALDPTMTGTAMREFFGSMPGIGPVTARYLACLHRRCDELAVDSFVLRYVGDKYHGGKKPTVRQVERRYAPFGDLKALAYWFELLGDVDPVTWRVREGGGRAQ